MPPSPKSSSQQRIVSLQVCRGLAAMAVVLAHLHDVEHKYFSSNIMGVFQYGVSGVDLFFIISGIVISAVTVGKFHDTRKAFTFLYHRFARIYPIYWVYSLIVLTAFLYRPAWINGHSGHQVEILRSLFLLPSHHAMLIMQGWTLSYEIYFYLVFFVLLWLSTEAVAPWLLLFWGALLVALFAFNVTASGPVTSALLNLEVLEFLAGCLLFHLYRRSNLHPTVGVCLIVASLVWLTAVILWNHHYHGASGPWIEGSPLRCVLFGGFAFLFIAGSMELERTGIIRFSRPLIAIGDWSYSIYLSHIIVIELVARTLHHFAPNLPLSILWVDAVALPSTLLVGYLSYSRIEVPLLNRFYKRKPPTTSPHPAHTS